MSENRVAVRALSPDEWPLWKSLRIAALADSPAAFGETLEFAAGAGSAERRALVATAD